MALNSLLPAWSLLAPALAWLVLAGHWLGAGGALYSIVIAASLLAGVAAAVHHAELVAHRVGEPFGTLVLAAAVTAIEVAIIVSLMLAGGPATTALARDTVFATVMIILNGVVGLCLIVGGSRYREQQFGLYGVTALVAALAAIVVLTLVLPNYTTTVSGPYYSPAQLGFVALVSLLLYGTVLFAQTVRHRDYFLPPDCGTDTQSHAPPPSNAVTFAGAAMLLVCLGAVVLLAKALSHDIEAAVLRAGAPQEAVGVVVAAIVLMPESYAAMRAARFDRLQTSLNLALGSALASIGLTIPAVAAVSIVMGWPLTLGIDGKSTVLLALSLLVASLSLGTGRTTILQGAIHLFVFSVYVFTAIVP